MPVPTRAAEQVAEPASAGSSYLRGCYLRGCYRTAAQARRSVLTLMLCFGGLAAATDSPPPPHTSAPSPPPAAPPPAPVLPPAPVRSQLLRGNALCSSPLNFSQYGGASGFTVAQCLDFAYAAQRSCFSLAMSVGTCCARRGPFEPMRCTALSPPKRSLSTIRRLHLHKARI